jgi:hypothetical protein
MVRRLVYISLLTFLFTSCFKEEAVYPPLEPFQMQWEQRLDSNGMLFINIENRQITKESNPYLWDLSFETAPSAFQIHINKGKGMGIYNTRSTTFDSVFNSDISWTHLERHAEGKTETLLEWGDFSFEQPQSYSQVYLIHRGFDVFGNPMSVKKFQVVGFENNAYLVRHANLDGTGYIEAEVQKADSVSHVYLSLSGGGKETVLEPKKDDWHLVMTPFLTANKRPNPFATIVSSSYYIEDQVLINPSQCQVAVDSTIPFEEFSYFDAQDAVFTEASDFIGGQWYIWNPADARMEVKPNVKFILKIQETYYLLQFLDYSKTNRRENAVVLAIKNL